MQKIRRTGGLFLSHCALCTRRNSVQLLDTMPPSVTLHPLTAIQALLPESWAPEAFRQKS